MLAGHFQKALSAALALVMINSGFSAAWGAAPVPGTQSAASADAGAVNGGISIMEPFPVIKEERTLGKREIPLVERYLISGKYADGESALNKRLETNPKDDQARFGLGMLQFLAAVRDFGHGLYKYGLRDFAEPELRLPFQHGKIKTNPTPEKIDYYKFRTLIEAFDTKVTQAEATLACVTDDKVQLPLHFGLIRMDMTGEGPEDENKSLWKLYANISQYKDITVEEASRFYIKFDRGDVHWLRGYCHVFLSLCDFYLAHDAQETFERTAHFFFTRVDSPYAILMHGKKSRTIGPMETDFLDLFALVHLINWKVVAAPKMEACLHHLESVIAQSRVSWKYIMSETDDDHEWLPNPKQTGVIPNMRVTDEMVTSWAKIMDEAEKLLSGKLLIPFWRGDTGMGINLRKVFMDPHTFDVVLWVQGSAAVPYLEKGPMANPKDWREMTTSFGNRFPGFAIWFN